LEKHCSNLQLFGDSKIICNWIKKNIKLLCIFSETYIRWGTLTHYTFWLICIPLYLQVTKHSCRSTIQRSCSQASQYLADLRTERWYSLPMLPSTVYGHHGINGSTGAWFLLFLPFENIHAFKLSDVHIIDMHSLCRVILLIFVELLRRTVPPCLDARH